MIITLQHLRTVPSWTNNPGYCNKGARPWFARHGLDWAAFVRDGIESDVLMATGDALAMRLVRFAEESENGQQ